MWKVKKYLLWLFPFISVHSNATKFERITGTLLNLILEDVTSCDWFILFQSIWSRNSCISLSLISNPS